MFMASFALVVFVTSALFVFFNVNAAVSIIIDVLNGKPKWYVFAALLCLFAAGLTSTGVIWSYRVLKGVL